MSSFNLATNLRIFWQKAGGLEAGFLALLVAAAVMRLWELGGRAMHYDEAIHLHYAWKLSNLDGFIHSPWMHGPFQIEFTALIFRVLGDTDFTARLGYALFGVALVALPYFLRHHLGRAGSLLAGTMLAVSPTLLYFSRFGRNDILMAFWATALLVLLWRYIHEEKDRYLYLASAVLALMFATKETAYFVALIVGGLAFLLAMPQLAPALFRRASLKGLGGPAAFFLLIFTLTLPQWSAAAGLLQNVLGLILVSPEGVDGAVSGAPRWAGPWLILPVYKLPEWFHLIPALGAAGGLFLLGPKSRFSPRSLAILFLVPLAVILGVYLAFFQPIGNALAENPRPIFIDLPLAGALVIGAIGGLMALHLPWKRILAMVLAPAALAVIYLALFTSAVNVDLIVNGLLPSGIRVDASANGIPLNFVVAGAILLLTFLGSAALGLAWRGGVWLACAAIFYLVWLTLYTTLFTNWAGAFTGVWQGMGYWIAQQEVARGNQPWYYYFVGLSVYELLPVLFGGIGAAYFLKKGDVLGLALAFWAGLSLLAYTLASEKMPWLLVNITLPFILLAGKYLGELAEMVRWRQAATRGTLLLLLLPPAAMIAGLFLLRAYIQVDNSLSTIHWLAAAGLAVILVLGAILVRMARPPSGVAMAGLGAAALLLVFGAWSAFHAAYTFDDSRPEILVYAQGSADVAQTFRDWEGQVFDSAKDGDTTQVDYDLWYPFQWYVRDKSDEGTLRFACFKEEGEDGWTPSCSPVSETAELGAAALLLTSQHEGQDAKLLETYEKSGPLKNLLWFPESYRRPGENRQGEPLLEELAKDLQFFRDAASSRETWRRAIDYILFRDLQRGWYSSEYYSYIR
ncbi:MAG: TIGR03663 family protein [Chloroflexi bacterium]|nr:TIGR03663 family protein [Chloroflexota bacterium]